MTYNQEKVNVSNVVKKNDRRRCPADASTEANKRAVYVDKI